MIYMQQSVFLKEEHGLETAIEAHSNIKFLCCRCYGKSEGKVIGNNKTRCACQSTWPKFWVNDYEIGPEGIYIGNGVLTED